MEAAASVGVGVAMMGVVYAVYNQALPSIVDQRGAPMNEPDSTSAEKTARWVSGGLVLAVSLITMDATVFILGGAAVVGFSWMYRHANMAVDHSGPTSQPNSRNLASANVQIGQAELGLNAGY
jgi:hypothetical protein